MRETSVTHPISDPPTLNSFCLHFHGRTPRTPRKNVSLNARGRSNPAWPRQSGEAVLHRAGQQEPWRGRGRYGRACRSQHGHSRGKWSAWCPSRWPLPWQPQRLLLGWWSLFLCLAEWVPPGRWGHGQHGSGVGLGTAGELCLGHLPFFPGPTSREDQTAFVLHVALSFWCPQEPQLVMHQPASVPGERGPVPRASGRWALKPHSKACLWAMPTVLPLPPGAGRAGLSGIIHPFLLS